ncbi:hypothetical protein BKA83DRAFT_4157069 [Pisolithus microcarpus]|nr:hypothetical protein BKA83DRAFT_4157069 [Pisolithus microcarpus]
MVLKYSDGRGDVPISHYESYPRRQPSHRGPTSHSRPQTPHRHSHDRSRSVAGHRPVTPVHHYHGHDDFYYSEKYGQVSPNYVDYDSAPEEIQVLPADPNVKPQRVTGSYRPRRASEPYQPLPLSQPSRESDVYGTPPPRHVHHTFNVPAVTYSHSPRIHDPYDHHHLSHSHSRGNRPHPSIGYPPGHNRNTDHYAPPPNAPGFPQYPRVVPTPYPPVHSHSHRGPAQEEQRYVPRGPRPREDMPLAIRPSTYYVLPLPGHKVKSLVGTEPSLYNGSATTKSASSMPRTPDSIRGRGPNWFSRILSKAARSSRSLHRRHSVDISTRSQSRGRR